MVSIPSPDFKKLSPRRITSSPVAHADVAHICEPDEQWSSSAVWPDSTGSGTRTTQKRVVYWPTLLVHEPMQPVASYWHCSPPPFNIGMLTTDEWGSYARDLPKEKHLTGKLFTQRIERNNLTLRTRIKRLSRRTICFSRSVELHEKVTGAFIEMNRPDFPGEYFSWELRLPDPYSRLKHNMPVRLLPVGYAPAFPASGDCCTSPPTPALPAQLLHGFSSFACVSPPLCTGH